jgi:hypothetical protein
MKITITIEIETHEEIPPSVEVSQVDAPHLEERTQTTLEEFTTPSIGEELYEAYKPRTIAPREHLTYVQGRNIHRCTNCGAPHRRVDKNTGHCLEATCESGVWQG